MAIKTTPTYSTINALTALCVYYDCAVKRKTRLALNLGQINVESSYSLRYVNLYNLLMCAAANCGHDRQRVITTLISNCGRLNMWLAWALIALIRPTVLILFADSSSAPDPLSRHAPHSPSLSHWLLLSQQVVWNKPKVLRAVRSRDSVSKRWKRYRDHAPGDEHLHKY